MVVEHSSEAARRHRVDALVGAHESKHLIVALQHVRSLVGTRRGMAGARTPPLNRGLGALPTSRRRWTPAVAMPHAAAGAERADHPARPKKSPAGQQGTNKHDGGDASPVERRPREETLWRPAAQDWNGVLLGVTHSTPRQTPVEVDGKRADGDHSEIDHLLICPPTIVTSEGKVLYPKPQLAPEPSRKMARRV